MFTANRTGSTHAYPSHIAAPQVMEWPFEPTHTLAYVLHTCCQASLRDAEVRQQWEEERVRQAIQASIEEENLRKALQASRVVSTMLQLDWAVTLSEKGQNQSVNHRETGMPGLQRPSHAAAARHFSCFSLFSCFFTHHTPSQAGPDAVRTLCCVSCCAGHGWAWRVE